MKKNKSIYVPSSRELEKLIEDAFAWLSKEPCQICGELGADGFFAYYRKDLTPKQMVKTYLKTLK